MDTDHETARTKVSRPVMRYSGLDRVRFRAQQRAERLWHLQRQVSDHDWASFIREHPEYGGWYHWIPTRPR